MKVRALHYESLLFFFLLNNVFFLSLITLFSKKYCTFVAKMNVSNDEASK